MKSSRPRILSLVALVGALLLSSWARPATAQIPAPGNAVSSVTLVADARANRPFMAALVFKLDPGWHLYWKNPGDAGLAPRVKWRLPEGWTAGLLEHPAPVRFDDGDVVSYGHAGEVVLLTRITPGGGRGTIAADVEWLVCKDECLMGRASVSLDPSSLGRDERHAAAVRVDRASDLLPRPASSSSITMARAAVVEKETGLYEARIRLVGANTRSVNTRSVNARGATAFYPEKAVGVVFEHGAVRVENGTIVVPFRREGNATRRFALRGVLVAPSGSYTLLTNVELPLRR